MRSGRPVISLDFTMPLAHRAAHMGVLSDFTQVAETFEVEVSELYSASTTRAVAARRALMYLLRTKRGLAAKVVAWMFALPPTHVSHAVTWVRRNGVPSPYPKVPQVSREHAVAAADFLMGKGPRPSPEEGLGEELEDKIRRLLGVAPPQVEAPPQSAPVPREPEESQDPDMPLYPPCPT